MPKDDWDLNAEYSYIPLDSERLDVEVTYPKGSEQAYSVFYKDIKRYKIMPGLLTIWLKNFELPKYCAGFLEVHPIIQQRTPEETS